MERGKSSFSFFFSFSTWHERFLLTLQPASGRFGEENNGRVLLKRAELNENPAMVALIWVDSGALARVKQAQRSTMNDKIFQENDNLLNLVIYEFKKFW